MEKVYLLGRVECVNKTPLVLVDVQSDEDGVTTLRFEPEKEAESPPALACSCGECEWRVPQPFGASPGWIRNGATQAWVTGGYSFELGLSCPICGDILRDKGEVVRMVSVEALKQWYGGALQDNDGLFHAICDLVKQPIGGK